jgi:hypothetical protein
MQSLKQISIERLELLVKQKSNNFRKHTDNGVVIIDETSEFELYGTLLRDAYHYAAMNPVSYNTLGDLLDILIQEELLNRKNHV